MDKYEAQYNFWSSFGVPAYEENSVPDSKENEYPYITYQAAASGFDGSAIIVASIWTRSTSWLSADTIAKAIESRLENGGELVKYTGGAIWVTPGDPLIQNMGDPSDYQIKRKLITVTLYF